MIMNAIGIIVGFGGLIGVNITSISYSCNSYSYSFGTTTTASPNSCVLAYNYAQMGMAGAIFIACISFICAMQCVGGMRIGVGGGSRFGRSHFGHHRHHHGFGHHGGRRGHR